MSQSGNRLLQLLIRSLISLLISTIYPDSCVFGFREKLIPSFDSCRKEKYKLGNIWDGVTNTALREEFRSCNAYAREECDDCWARLYCSGGCAANAYHATGSIRGVYEAGCELFKKRIECAIMMKVAQSQGED